jgi:hypothetical protein
MQVCAFGAELSPDGRLTMGKPQVSRGYFKQHRPNANQYSTISLSHLNLRNKVQSIVMLLKTFFLTVSIGAALAAPTVQLGARKNDDSAVINSRFAKYEAEKRDAEAGTVINSRFAKYETEKRDIVSGKVINSRFAKYEAEKRGAEAGKVINSRFAKYGAE